MEFVCKKCEHAFEIKPANGNVIAFCPRCKKYINSVSDYGFGPITPCDIFMGKKMIGHVKEASDGIYRLLSPELGGIAVTLKGGYDNLECYHEAATCMEKYLNKIPTLLDTTLSAEDNAISDNKRPDYETNNTDRALSELAEVIITSYNGSYKPHLLPNIFNIHVKHTDEGYSSIREENERGLRTWAECAEHELSAFVNHFFLWYGKQSVDWDKIITSPAVIKAVIEWFGVWINEDLHDAEFEFKQLDSPNDYFNNPPLCGICQIKDEWVFVHQNYSPFGDNPYGDFYTTANPSLIALIEGEVIRIGCKIRIKAKGKT